MRILFVHGFGCSPQDWSAQLGSLNVLGDVAAVDLRNIGSAPPTAHSLISEMADRVNFIRSPAGMRRAVLVGHSMGCRIVLEAVRRLPDAVAGLVLIEGSLRASGNAAEAVKRYLSVPVEDNKALLMRDFAGMFSDRTPEAFRRHVLQRAAEMDVSYAVRLMADMTYWDAAEAADALRVVRVPILVLQTTFKEPGGVRRPIGCDETSPWLKLVAEQAASRAQIIRLAGLGHFPQAEAPEMINRLIADFVVSLSLDH